MDQSLHYQDHGAQTREYVTVRIAEQLLGLPVLEVQDVLNAQQITAIPLAPPWVAGVLNLRGRIVTAIDLRERLKLPPRDRSLKSMSVVVEHRGEPYSLLIDQVGEVLSLRGDTFEKNPITLNQVWREVSAGIYRLDNELLAILDVNRLLDFETSSVQAA